MPAQSPEVSLAVNVGHDPAFAAAMLETLAVPYQRHVAPDAYGIVSAPSGDSRTLSQLVLEASEAPFVGVLAHPALLSPRLFEHVLLARNLADDPVIVVPNYVLSSAPEAVPSELAAAGSVDYRSDGFRLFDVASFAPDQERGYLGPLSRAACFFARRESLAEALTIADGLPDVFDALTTRSASRFVVLAGEGAFHSTPRPVPEAPSLEAWLVAVPREPLFFGAVSGPAQRLVAEAADWALMFHGLAMEFGKPAFPMDP